MNYIKNKASKKFGFLKRTYRQFKNKSALITLNNLLVHSHFNYALLTLHTYLVTKNPK